MKEKKDNKPVILLTGPTGQIGTELFWCLSSLGRVVPVPEPLQNVPLYIKKMSQGLTVNLAHPSSIVNIVHEVKPSLIVNAAAYTAVDKAESEERLANAINAEAPGILAEEGKRFRASIVHYSSDYIFDGSGQLPRDESAKTGIPLSVYGKSKLAGEKAIQEVGIPHLILRTSWIYAPYGANFVKTVLRLAAERPELRIVNDQIGTPNPARVIAEITGLILSQASGNIEQFIKEKGGALNVCCEGEASWHGFATEIVNLAKHHKMPLKAESIVPIKTEEFPLPAKRPLNSRLDISRLKTVFNIYPPEWLDALTMQFAYFA